MSFLVVDYKIDLVIKQIQKEILETKGKNIPYNAIVSIIDSQIESTVRGMANGDSIVWKYFGTFFATKKRVDALNKRYKSLGKIPTLVDTGLVRMSFKKNGIVNGETSLDFPCNGNVIEEVPDKYKDA